MAAQEPHPLEAPEVLSKEPAEVVRLQFDWTDSLQLNTSETLSSLVSTVVTPQEEHHELAFSSLTDGPLIAGERLMLPGDSLAGVAREATASSSSTLGIVIPTGVTLTDGQALTGEDSGAVVTLSEDQDAGTKQAQTPVVDSSQIVGRVLELTMSNGLRPVAGAPHREYLVSAIVRTSLAQDLAAIGRLRIPEAASASNPR